MTLFSRIYGYVSRKFLTKIYENYFQWTGVKIKGKGIFYGKPLIELYHNSSIMIGENVVLCSKSEFTALGVNHPVIIRTLKENAEIIIGDNVGISGSSICAASKITIGNNTLIGANVMIIDTDFHPVNPVNRRYAHLSEAKTKPVTIGENVFIGAGSIVLKGVVIGDNSVVGAGSIVVHDIPANSIFAGNLVRGFLKHA